MPLLDIHQIKNYLPHRYPFLLVDRVIEAEGNDRLVAMKNVTYNEPFFMGHFPNRPVMPGVLIIEALAQSSAILASFGLEHVDTEKMVYYFTGIDKARFKRPVEPGDQLIFEIEMVRRIKNMWKCRGKALVDGQLVASADLMFTFKMLDEQPTPPYAELKTRQHGYWISHNHLMIDLFLPERFTTPRNCI